MTSLTARAMWWALLTLVWVALWGEPSIGNLIGGSLVATGVMVAVEQRDLPIGRIHPLAAAHFLGVIGWNLVKATTLVAWEVLTPRNRIVEGIIAVPFPNATPTVLTVVTNAIGLTPGTVVVEIDEDPVILYVHVLHLTDMERVRAELVRLVTLALRAFGSVDGSLVAGTTDDDEVAR